MTVAVLPEIQRSNLADRLPGWIEPKWWATPEELIALAPSAEIGWFDLHVKPPALEAVARARQLRWLTSGYAGVDWLPLADLSQRGIVLTCGSGLASAQVAEYAVLGMLALAKNFRTIARAQDRGHWLDEPAGDRDLGGSRALLLGHGAIGQAIERALTGFGVACEPVRRGDGGWREKLGTYDWIVMALPGTPETQGMIGAAEIAAMKPGAALVNCGRATTLDQEALVSALREGRLAGAILDVTDPEPLPPGHPLWEIESAIVTMHLSGVPTDASRERAALRFLRNCERFRSGAALEAQVDLARGY